MRRSLQRRRSASLVVALAFVTVFLGVAGVVAEIVTKERESAVALTHVTQTDFSGTAIIEEALHWTNANVDANATIAAQEAAAATRNEASAAAVRSALLGFGCGEWWIDNLNAASGTGRIIAESWTPGVVVGSGCVVSPRARRPAGARITIDIARDPSNAWVVLARTVQTL